MFALDSATAHADLGPRKCREAEEKAAREAAAYEARQAADTAARKAAQQQAAQRTAENLKRQVSALLELQCCGCGSGQCVHICVFEGAKSHLYQ
jgi:hypothetical protein